jgi:LPS export ABC transporter protein LptC
MSADTARNICAHLLLLICAHLCAIPGLGPGLFAAQDPAPGSDQQISEFSLAGYGDKGKKSWDLAGKSADIFTESVKLKEVTGNMYGKDEDVKVVADEGDFNKTDGRIKLEKNVVVTTSSGTRLATDSLEWDRRNQALSTDDRVNIQRQNMVIDAQGAYGQMGLNKVSLQRKVKLDILPEKKDAASGSGDSDKTTITCTGPLEVDYGKNVATFKKNVKVRRPDSTIHCDNMDLYFASAKKDKAAAAQGGQAEAPKEKDEGQGFMGNKIEKIVCRGNVKVVRGDNVSYSDEAVYSAVEKRLVLTGRPKLVIASMEGISDASFGN